MQVDEITGDVNRSQLPRALFHIDRARRIALCQDTADIRTGMIGDEVVVTLEGANLVWQRGDQLPFFFIEIISQLKTTN